MKLYESKAYSPTQLWWRSWTLTLLPLSTCVQRTGCLTLARCRRRSPPGEGGPPADTPRQWRSHWDLLLLWAQLQEHLAPVLQKPEEQKQEKKRSVIETYWETEISGCDFCVRALLQTRALRKNDGHFMANVSKTIHMLLPKPKRKRVRCLSALAFVSAPYW